MPTFVRRLRAGVTEPALVRRLHRGAARRVHECSERSGDAAALFNSAAA